MITAYCVALLLQACADEGRYKEALTPDEALKRFELHEGFTIENVASEPLVMDPVEMVFDEDGRIYVLEMGDYPYKPEQGQGRGKIRLLSDTSGDGKLDDAVIFAEGLADATSMLPWNGGLIVTSAPNILFLRDTTGDNKVDVNEVLFTGFFENNSEAQITNLRYGVDNWIYANNNGQKGEVKFNRKPDLPALPVAGGDFRFRLDKNLFEVESGAGQFGLAMDDWGNRFFTQNTLHIQMAPIPWRYLHRKKGLPSYAGVANIYAHDLTVFQISEPPYWRTERSKQRQQQYDEAGLDRVEHIEGHFTGASGGTLYAADLFPASFYGNVFTGEVACNLVHRDVIEPTDKGPFFSARRAADETDREFLASSDPWFRPVNFTVGPDGALYMLDMYRQHIETPVSIPEELKADMDFVHGNQYGRIYRIYPTDKGVPELRKPGLGDKPVAELVPLLAHANQWWRLQAQRLLVERQDQSVVPALEKLFNESTDPRARLHAMYTLEGLQALTSPVVEKALYDTNAQVRRHAIMLAEQFPEMLDKLVNMLDDPAPQTAFQAVLSVGQFTRSTAVTALAKAVLQHSEDEWYRKAVLSAESGTSAALLEALLANGFFETEADGKIKFMTDFSTAVGATGKLQDVLSIINKLTQPVLAQQAGFQQAVLSGFLKGAKKTTLNDADKKKLIAALQKQGTAITSAVSKKAIEEITTALNGPSNN